MLEFEFNGHKSSEFGVIISRVEENDNLISRSPSHHGEHRWHCRYLVSPDI